jgi:hypothetical protein
MAAYRGEAINALEGMITRAAHSATRTEWTLMPSDARFEALYQGYDMAKMLDAVRQWSPSSGSHDTTEQLNSAKGIAGEDGFVIFVTDRRRAVPEGVAIAAVGRPFPNVGFVGQRITTQESGYSYQVMVKNHSASRAERAYFVDGKRAGALSLEPGAIATIRGTLPPHDASVELALDHDGFTLDDNLALSPNQPKILKVAIASRDKGYGYFKRVVLADSSVELTNDIDNADVVLGWRDEEEGARPRKAIVVRPSTGEHTMSGAPIVSERAPLTDGLQFAGLLLPSAAPTDLDSGDRVLVWQGARPLVVYRTQGQLELEVDVLAGNAARNPALLIMLHRYLANVRDGVVRFERKSFELSEPLRLPRAPELATLSVTRLLDGTTLTRPIQPAELSSLAAPAEPTRFTVTVGGAEVLGGASSFADSREAGFDDAESFDDSAELMTSRLISNSSSDPLSALWIIALLACIAGAWMTNDGTSWRVRNVLRLS